MIHVTSGLRLTLLLRKNCNFAFIAQSIMKELEYLTRSDEDSCIKSSWLQLPPALGIPAPALELLLPVTPIQSHPPSSRLEWIMSLPTNLDRFCFFHTICHSTQSSPMLSAFESSSTPRQHVKFAAHLRLWSVALFALNLLCIAAASNRIEGLAERTYFYVGGRSKTHMILGLVYYT